MSNKKLEKALDEAYERLYAMATPPADFKQLVESATINDFGLKEIKYWDYEISMDDFDNVVDEIALKYKLKLYEKKSLSVSLCLGVSPKFKQ